VTAWSRPWISPTWPAVRTGYRGERRAPRKAEADDRLMVERIASRDAAGFFRLISDEKDARNVCGRSAIYSLLRLLGPGAPACLLRYGQAADRENHSVVTFAGIEFPRQG